jgi:hypothetical protein
MALHSKAWQLARYGESELGVLSSQCLDRRIPDQQTLINEIAAWEEDRNANHAKADWQFTTPEARIRLKHLYPSICLNRATSHTQQTLPLSRPRYDPCA